MFELPTTTPEMLAGLADAMRGQVVDGLSVHAATAKNDAGADGEPIVTLSLVLDDAAPELDTWPYHTLRAIDRLARDHALRLGIEEYVFIRRQGMSFAQGRERPRHRTSR